MIKPSRCLPTFVHLLFTCNWKFSQQPPSDHLVWKASWGDKSGGKCHLLWSGNWFHQIGLAGLNPCCQGLSSKCCLARFVRHWRIQVFQCRQRRIDNLHQPMQTEPGWIVPYSCTISFLKIDLIALFSLPVD